MQKLIINRLGPIEHCELKCSQFMTLTGFQASGKSTIAKAIYYFRTIKEDIIELAREQSLVTEPVSGLENRFNAGHKVELKKALENHLREKFLRTFGSSLGMSSEMYAEYYFYVMNGAKWTYGFTVLVFLVLIGALGNSPMAAFLGVVLAGLVMWYVEELLNDKLNARRDELLADLPQMLSKLTLLINAGMTTLNAWKKVAETSERVLYREMREVVAETQNGKDELEAYMNFADRCSIKEVRRFTSTIIQNKLRGNREEAYFLKELSDEMWEEKKHLVRRKGEAAKSKLLIPTTMIFIGILIMVMVPAFMGMNL